MNNQVSYRGNQVIRQGHVAIGNDQILYSPSDLVTFLGVLPCQFPFLGAAMPVSFFGCRHASFLDVKALSENMDKTETSATGQLLQQKGLEHEATYLQQLKTKASPSLKSPKIVICKTACS